MTQGQLVDLMIARLLREHGGAKHRWRKLIGPVRLYGAATHVHCNWAIDPTGSNAEIAAIERQSDDLRMSHPILAADG